MKRGDLLKELKGKLRASLMHKFMEYQDGNLSMGKLLELISFKSLTIVEQAGMLPPRCELTKLGTSDNAWEPEDDKE